MLSHLRKRKLTKLFHIWDSNKDGFIERADYALVAFRVAELSGTASGSPGYRTIQEGYLQNWEQLCRILDKEPNLGVINLVEYLHAQEIVLSNKADWRRYVRDHIHDLAVRADKDHDGQVTLAEYAGFACAYGIAVDVALKAAQSLDRDGDGFVLIEDGLHYLEEFYYSDDPSSPGNNFTGPLADGPGQAC